MGKTTFAHFAGVSRTSAVEKGQIFVVGCSTSEVAGKKIGTSGTISIAEAIFNKLQSFAKQNGIFWHFSAANI